MLVLVKDNSYETLQTTYNSPAMEEELKRELEILRKRCKDLESIVSSLCSCTYGLRKGQLNGKESYKNHQSEHRFNRMNTFSKKTYYGRRNVNDMYSYFNGYPEFLHYIKEDGIRSMRDLSRANSERIKKIKYIGPKKFEMIQEAIKQYKRWNDEWKHNYVDDEDSPFQ